MAYRRSTRARSANRRSTRRTYSARRSPARRRSTGRRSSPQTVRVVIEQAAPSAVARPATLGMKAAPQPRKAAF